MQTGNRAPTTDDVIYRRACVRARRIDDAHARGHIDDMYAIQRKSALRSVDDIEPRDVRCVFEFKCVSDDVRRRARRRNECTRSTDNVVRCARV